MPPPQDQKPVGPSREEILGKAGPLLGIGATFVASILVCLAGGWWLDRTFGTTPWLTIVGSLLGIVIGFYLLVKTIMATAKGDDHSDWTE
jgi:F0F1-type ATP synthase assembly protein I